MRGRAFTLREPRLADAVSLYARLTTPPVTRHISTPPSSPTGFERFISWVQNERSMGRHACFGIVPNGIEEPVGLVQVRQLEANFGNGEWGFALGEQFWGTGLFMEAAPLVLDFAFRDMRFHRLEARASVDNRRGNRVLEKLGAVFEGILRQSFSNEQASTDQMLWSIVADEWFGAHPVPSEPIGEPVPQPPEIPLDQRAPPLVPWRSGLPELHGEGVTIREVRLSDAESLASLFADPEVGRYIPPPPASAKDFVRFINWAREQRKSGSVLCFGVVPDGHDAAVGVLQLHELEPVFQNCEWGFVFGRPYWGTGLFQRAADLLLRFAFETVGVRRLEARAMAANPRANRVLRRLGATEEGHLRQSFFLGGRYHDDVLWSILADDWRKQHTTDPRG
jgi:RimJ/RimL family protein N-acetyltransferase